ncbi:MAG: SCO family protein [Hellea sp.]|nr:SCO family protein [Hellea sp.]
MKALIILIFSLPILLFGCSEQAAKSGKNVISGSAEIGGPFNLINQDNLLVTENDFLGKPQLIYFGFSYCPDICPTALQKMGSVQEELDTDGDLINYLFISVDPERDTSESLKLYVESDGFPKGLNGLTGSKEQVDIAKLAYKVYSQRVSLSDSKVDYTVDHSDIMYFMDENGVFIDFFFGKNTIQEIGEAVRKIVG